MHDHLSGNEDVNPTRAPESPSDRPDPGPAVTTGGTGLPVIVIARTALNVPLRLSHFFLPAIARGLGVSLSAGGALVSAANLVGLAGPIFGVFSDQFGGRRVMVFGTALFALAALLTAAVPRYGVALAAFALMSLAKIAFDPALQVFLGQRVPYERRGRALGLAELAWSFSLLAMPLSGWLIDTVSWRIPFLLLGLLSFPILWLTWRTLPPDGPPTGETGPPVWNLNGTVNSLADLTRQLLADHQSRLILATAGLIGFAQINILVVYGAWMEDGFGLSVADLGLVTLIIGAAELGGELAVAFISDRMGKRRSLIVAVICTALAYLGLPHLTGSLAAALMGTVLMTLFFEFTIVGLLPLISGVNANARGTVMALSSAVGSATRAIAAPVGVALYSPGDIGLNGLLSALACLGLLVVLLQIREQGH